MSEQPVTSPKKKKPPLWFFLWWETDPEDVERQITGYGTLRVWQSARGISLLLCLFTVVWTVAFAGLVSLSSGAVLTEVILWSALGLLMYTGQRWAFIAAMVLWTLEKGLVVAVVWGTPPVLFMQIFWWAIFMNAFMLGFKVELQRRTTASAV